MAYFSIVEVRAAARDFQQSTGKSVSTLLEEARDTAHDRFDIFLSHSSIDRELVLGAKALIERTGKTVYVDWIDDAQFKREAADRDTAVRLRRRMQQSDSLFYAHTPNASLSRWCPWELGYFDALRRPEERVFVMPILQRGQVYEGQEYLSLYETVDLARWRPSAARRGPSVPLDPLRIRRNLLGPGFSGPFL